MNFIKKTKLQITILLLLFITILLKSHIASNEVGFLLACEYYNVSFHDIENNIYLDKDEMLIDFTIGDIDSDGNDEMLILSGDKGEHYGKELIIYDFIVDKKGLNFKEIYRNNISLINPWRIETCDIDGDGELEIFIAVNKSTRYYKEVDNRPFFFNFKDGMLVKKWTGSKVRWPFQDVYFEDVNGNGSDEFIVIENVNDEGYVVAVYYWFGFGFILHGESVIYDDISSLEVKSSEKDIFLEVKVKDDGKYRLIELMPSVEKTENDIYLLKERGL